MIISPHEEAARSIRGKLPVTRRIWDAMGPELRGASFSITGVEDLHAIERVRNLVAQVPEGTDWDETKDAVAAELVAWLDDEEAADRRAELILRSHGYAAYSKANYEALEAESDIFTWRKYQTAQDELVRGSHAALDGLILPADSPFWIDHTPPWEFGCRCDAVGMTDEEVEEIRFRLARNITPIERPKFMIVDRGAELAALEAGHLYRDGVMNFVARNPDGFRFDPRGGIVTVDMLQSLRKRVGPKVWDGFADWARNAEVPGEGDVWAYLTKPPRKRRKRSAAALRPVSADEARKEIAGLEPDFDAVEKEIADSLRSEGYWPSLQAMFAEHPDQRPDIPAIADAYRKRDELVARARALIAVDPGAKRPFRPPVKARNDKAVLTARQGEALDLWSQMLGASKVEELNRRLPLSAKRLPGGRAYYDMKGAVHLSPANSTSVHMHELAHWMEHASPDLLARSVQFLQRRTAGDPVTFYNGHRNEPVKADQFFLDYCGKLYQKLNGDFYATEILSMGIERYTFDPIRFAKEDPDYFDFIYDTLRQPL